MSRRTLEPGDVQRVLHLRYSEHMAVADIASKLRCTPRVVSEILANYERGEHVRESIHLSEARREAWRRGRINSGLV